MKKYILTPLIGLTLFSCNLDENINPNNPSLDQITARQRLSAAQTSTYEVQASSMNGLGNVWMNSWSGNVYYFGNPLTKETNLNIDASFYSRIWNSTYIAVGRLQKIIDSKSSQNLPYHKAIAKILKAHYMQYIVDLYGDVPYSEAFKEQANPTPKYDKDVDVYKALVKELDEAIELIKNNAPTSANEVGEEDVVMHGDMDKWLKFANTVKLRFLVRASKTTNAEALKFAQSQLPTLKGAQFVDFDVSINPGYSSATSDNQNPLYGAFGIRSANGTINTYGWRLYKASKHMGSLLNGEQGTMTEGVIDPRRFDIFSPRRTSNGLQVIGVEQGSLKNSNFIERDFSWIGGMFMASAQEGSAKDGYLMLRAESEFLQADAAIVYPSYFNDAKTHFNNGIEASFEFYGKGNEASNYIVAIDGKDGAGWTGSMDKTAAIQYQRWVALTNFNGMEVYLNYLKTGYPKTPLAVNAQKPRKPYRLVYPSSEYSTNPTNVPKMTGEDAFVINELTPFWLK